MAISLLNSILIIALLGGVPHELPMTLPGAALYDAPHGNKIADLPAGIPVYPLDCIKWLYMDTAEVYAKVSNGYILMNRNLAFGDNWMRIRYVSAECMEDGREVRIW